MQDPKAEFMAMQASAQKINRLRAAAFLLAEHEHAKDQDIAGAVALRNQCERELREAQVVNELKEP